METYKVEVKDRDGNVYVIPNQTKVQAQEVAGSIRDGKSLHMGKDIGIEIVVPHHWIVLVSIQPE